MNAAPKIDAHRPYLRVVSETTGEYDSGERRPTPSEAAGGERHARIPFTVLSAELSPQAIVAYAWLQNHIGDDGCFPSFETLATEMHCSVRAAKARVAELEASHFLSHRQRGLGRSNVYDLHPDGDAQTPKPRRRNPEVQKTARQAREVQKTARPEVQSSVNRSAENCTLIIPSNQNQLTKDSAPTERSAPPSKPAAKSAVTTPKQPTSTVEATPPEREHVPRAKRASAASDDGFGLVRWLLKEQGGVALPSYRVAADAKAADTVLARMGTEEAAREHATARLMEPRRTTLLWSHILEDVQRTEAARQRGVVERRPYGGRVNGQGGTISSGQVALDRALEEWERGHTGDDQGAEDTFGVWPEQRAEDERRPEPGSGRILEAGNGLPVRMVRPSGVND